MDYRHGEILLIDYLRNKLHYEVADVSDDVFYQLRDIDILAHNEFRTVGIEVKWDNRIADTGNMFIEEKNDASVGGHGWYEFTEAEFLAYGDSRNKIFYMIPIDEFREFFKREKYNYKNVSVPVNYANQDGRFSDGVLIPIKRVLEAVHVQIIYL